MSESYFIWRGIDSRNMNIWVQSAPAIVRPPMRYQQVIIPGRPGALTLLEGEDTYDAYEREIRVMPKPGADIYAILRWLTGRSSVIFSCEPNRSQRANIYDPVEFQKEFCEQRSATLTFLCDPFKTSTDDQEEYEADVSGSSCEIQNHGDVLAYPLIEISATETITLTVNGTPITLTGLEGHTATIDCEARTTYMEVEDEPEPEPEPDPETEGEGTEGTEEQTETTEEQTETPAEQTETTEEQTETPAALTTHMEPVVTHGDYAVLPCTGTTTIEWTTGVTSLKIYPRWRWF